MEPPKTRRGLPQATRPALLLFACALLVYSATVGTEVSMDVWTADYAAWNVARTGHGWLDLSTVPFLDHHPLRDTWVVASAHGHEAIGRAPGTVALSLPAYWIAGLATMSVVPAGLTAAVLVAAADVLLFLALRDRLGQRGALLASIVFGFATPVWTVAANGMWPHTLTVLGIAGMAWAAERDRWWLVGVFGGITLWGRLHAALICAVVGIAVAVHRRDPLVAVRAGLASGLLLGLMTLWNHWMYGTWDPTAAYRTGDFTTYAEGHRLDLVNQLGFWVSPDRGLLVWSPLLLVLAPALFRNWRALPDWSRWLLVGGLAYQVLQGVLNRFSGGDTFYGYRLGLELLACAAPALALSAYRLGPIGRRLVVPVAAVQFAMIVVGAGNSSYGTADDVWTQNSFVEAVRRDPAGIGIVALLALCGVVLFARIWRNPGLTRGGGGDA